MTGRAARSRLLLALLPVISACSTDALTPPEPVVGDPGAFVAATDVEGVIFLIRTLRIVPIDSTESLLQAIHYRVAPSSYEEARTLAKEPELPILDARADFSLRAVLSLDHEVVWFRTLTEQELTAMF